MPQAANPSLARRTRLDLFMLPAGMQSPFSAWTI